MSVFDLFRGFFGVPRGHYGGRRDPFFDAMTHDEDDDDDEEGFLYDRFHGERQDPIDGTWRFGFSFGPNGTRFQEPPAFGHILREMEEIFSQLGHWEGQTESGVSMLPPPEYRAEQGNGRSSRNPLRDFMLKYPDSDSQGPPCSLEPGYDRRPSSEFPAHPSSPFRGLNPFSKFDDIWKKGPQKAPEEERKEDRDLDSAVSSGGLDEVLAPSAGQTPNLPKTRSFFQSVTVTKVVKPDGSVEERRTVRDSQGKEETTITVSGGSGSMEGPGTRPAPIEPGGQQPFPDMRDDNSLFSRFFRGGA